MQRKVRNPNIEFVETPTIINGEKYYQIRCVREFKCSFNKRFIKAGELGGYFHELAIDQNDPCAWIEQNYIIGAPICEMAYLQPIQREDFMHSNILSFRTSVKIMTDMWQIYFGTQEPSMVNDVMYKSTNILLLIDEIYELEEKINHKGFINEMQIILLWLMLGSILDAFLKIHATIFRNTNIIANQCTKDKKEAWSECSSILIYCLEKREDLTREECIVLEQINNNRNYIHFLNIETPFSYDKYKQYVDMMFNILNKLFAIQKNYKKLT